MTDRSSTIIAATGLSKRFAGVAAIKQLSFACARGEIFGFVGPDGAGKTTVMRLLAGVMAPDDGSIAIDGVDVVKNPELAKSHISYMPQRFGLYEDLTVDENIAFFADLFEIDRKSRDERAVRLLAASGMTPFRKRLAGQLSGGMKQKLGLTCSLIHTPKVLLLDEPTAGVDPVSRRDFWRILYGLRAEGVTIVISTSYLDEAERCTRLGLLQDGRMPYCDTPANLKKLMPGELVSIASREGRAARDATTRLEGVAGVLLVGDGIHVVVDDAQRRIPELRQALAAAGVPFEQIEELAPSIEDIFVSLLARPADAA
ncbi:MAG: ABC transporter ATP-binding protein [Roseiarcus sp.]|jgi:ABC-2 type transport system ATP-binding protein